MLLIPLPRTGHLCFYLRTFALALPSALSSTRTLLPSSFSSSVSCSDVMMSGSPSRWPFPTCLLSYHLSCTIEHNLSHMYIFGSCVHVCHEHVTYKKYWDSKRVYIERRKQDWELIFGFRWDVEQEKPAMEAEKKAKEGDRSRGCWAPPKRRSKLPKHWQRWEMGIEVTSEWSWWPCGKQDGRGRGQDCGGLRNGWWGGSGNIQYRRKGSITVHHGTTATGEKLCFGTDGKIEAWV